MDATLSKKKTGNITTWKIDPVHSEVSFKVKHMMISTVTGHFKEFHASLLTGGDVTTINSLQAEIEVSSLSTNNEDRDNHLKSDDFFNADDYPKIIFKGKSKDGSKLIGQLHIRDIVREVSLDADLSGPALDPYGQTKVGLEIRGEISRKDFGLKWNAVTEAGSVVVGDTVKLIIDAQFIKATS